MYESGFLSVIIGYMSCLRFKSQCESLYKCQNISTTVTIALSKNVTTTIFVWIRISFHLIQMFFAIINNQHIDCICMTTMSVKFFLSGRRVVFGEKLKNVKSKTRIILLKIYDVIHRYCAVFIHTNIFEAYIFLSTLCQLLFAHRFLVSFERCNHLHSLSKAKFYNLLYMNELDQ